MEKDTQLCIHVENSKLRNDLLAGFQYREGQSYNYRVADSSNANRTWLVLELGEFGEISPEQEEYLKGIDIINWDTRQETWGVMIISIEVNTPSKRVHQFDERAAQHVAAGDLAKAL